MDAVLSWLSGIGAWFLATINSLLNWIYSLLKSFVFTLVDAFHDLFCWLFDQILSLLVSILHSIDITQLPVISDYVSALPPSLLSVMGLLGAGQAMSIIVVAIGIRLLLQLIPFVRLGS